VGETANLVSLWRRARDRGEQVCLATVVHIEGSSYRKPGARMLLTSTGERVGTISGGCLEAEISRKAWWLTEDGPTVQKFESSLDEDDGRPRHGLGCGGIVSVLLEREPHHVLSALADSLEKGMACVVLHRIRESAGPVGSTVLPARSPDADETYGNGVADTWAEFLQPPPRLTILGAGDDALPLARFIDEIGWRVRVADARTHLLRAERFPSNVELVPLEHVDPQLDVGADDFAVILTHSYEQDRALLQALLPAGLRYLGILGPRHRTARLIEDVAPALKWSLTQCWNALHSPVGLDLGTRDPASIALAIAAELQATASSRSVAVSRLS
jgi:xanthine/CO dehydrogenase XdhC/CoxF family maturation factor